MSNQAWIWASAVGVACLVTLGAHARTGFVRSFDVVPEKYVGTWYEIARTPNDFEDDLPTLDGTKYGPCLDPTAIYALLGDGRVGVHNVCTRAAISNTAKQTLDEVSGVARIARRERLPTDALIFTQRGPVTRLALAAGQRL